MLRLIPAPAPVHFTNLERGGSALPETMNHLTTALRKNYWSDRKNNYIFGILVYVSTESVVL